MVENALQGISAIRRRCVQVIFAGLIGRNNAACGSARSNVFVNYVCVCQLCTAINVANLRRDRCFDLLHGSQGGRARRGRCDS